MREQKTKTIGTTTYAVTQMDAVRGLKTQAKLVKILGTSILEVLGKDFTKLQDMSGMIEKLMNNFDDTEVVNFVLSLFENGVFIKEDGKADVVLDFSDHFAGKLTDMWKLAAFILEVNFNLGKFTQLASSTTKEVEEETKES
ncbi:MAG: hypothetical protein GY861_24430 [bacterium]|nr:hypothetical protein [bacterium]